MKKLQIGQKVAWKNRNGLQVGKIVDLPLGDIVGTPNRPPGLRRQRLAHVKLDSGTMVMIDRHYLTQKESGLAPDQWKELTEK